MLHLQELEIPSIGHGPPPVVQWHDASRNAPAEAAAPEEASAAQAEAGFPDKSLLAPQEECSICLNSFERPTVTPCSHWFCR